MAYIVLQISETNSNIKYAVKTRYNKQQYVVARESIYSN